jgi:hypothetical protein
MPTRTTPRHKNDRWLDALLLGMVLVSIIGLIYSFVHH